MANMRCEMFGLYNVLFRNRAADEGRMAKWQGHLLLTHLLIWMCTNLNFPKGDSKKYKIDRFNFLENFGLGI